MATRTITGLFDDYAAAARAVDTIEAVGVSHGDISIVANNEGDRHAGVTSRDTQQAHAQDASAQDASAKDASAKDAYSNHAHAMDGHDESDASDGAGTGATLGTVLGGGAGLLAGLGLMAIPGVGPVVAAGWLVATLTGAGVGAATGGLLGALTGAGLSDSEAEHYAEGVRRGGTLVTVRTDESRAERVTALLAEHGSIDLDQRAQNWRSEGWTGGTVGEARPATHEIGSSRIGAAGSTTTGLDTESGRTLLGAEPSLAEREKRDLIR